MQEIAADHPYIFYVGRVDFSAAQAPAFSHPGVNIRIRFTGTYLGVQLRDNALKQTVETTNYFNVIIDGKAPVLLKTTPHQKTYVLAEKLSSGEHLVELFKRSESSHGDELNVGKVSILGFQIDAHGELLPPEPKKNRMEFIGDSITCGYGNELSTNDPSNDHFTTLNSNAYMAWGAIAARELNAEYVAVAYSGRGVVRNYGGHDSPTVPDMYLKTLPDDPTAAQWNPSQYVPDVVVINLGSNDFSEGLASSEAVDSLQTNFGKKYLAFLRELSGYYKEAQFVLVIGPMLSDGYPEGYNALSRVRTELENIVSTLQQETPNGESRVRLLELTPQSAPFGEDFHPTIATHQKMARELVDFLQTHHMVVP